MTTTRNDLRKLPSELAPSPAARHIIKSFEGGPMLVSYQCSADKWTFGWGSTRWEGKPVQPNTQFTLEQCSEAFERDLYDHANIIRKLVVVPLSQNEFDALTCFAYNFGEANIAGSKTLAVINSGDYDQVPHWLIKWKNERVNGALQPSEGLYRRRLAESLMWLGLPWEDATSRNLISLDTSLKETIDRAKREQFADQVKEVVTPKPEPVTPPKHEEKSTPPNPEKPKKPKIETKPASRDSVPLEKIPEVHPGIDVTKGAKPLEDSERAVGFALVFMGHVVRWGTAFGTIPLALGHVFLDMLQDPAMMAIMVGAGTLAVSQVLLWYGRWKRKRGTEKASQVLI